MTAPEIRGEKTTLYGYEVRVAKKVYLTVDENGLHVRPVVYVVVAHPEDPRGYYIYKVEEGGERTYDWFIGLSVAEMYREVKGQIDALHAMVREKIAAFDALKELLEKEGVIVSATCYGYYKDKEDVIKELQ
jgi:hypothetical protein